MALISDLVQFVLQKTKDGKLQWEVLGDDFYQAPIGDNVVTIDSQRRTYSFTVRNSLGQIVDRLDAVFGEGDILESLFNMARRQALKTDEILEDMMTNLRKL